jgi:hypothetical protein
MLVDIDIWSEDPIMAIFARAENKFSGAKEVATGMYVINHFNFNSTLKHNGYKIEEYPEFGYHLDCYGVCDTPDQLIGKFPGITTDPRKFVISFTEIRRDEQSDWGGWRWHKWGPYIGDQMPTTEYIYDEPEIEVVWVYHIYEVMT